MKDKILLTAVISLLCVATALLFTSCGEPQTFVKSTAVYTTRPTTEPPKVEYSELEFLGTKMGMSLEETQQALGVPIAVRTNSEGILYFFINKSGLDFLNEGMESLVYFIYNSNLRLCEVQYASNNDTGFVLDEVLQKFDSQYGKHVVVEADEEGKTNYIWFYGGDYIIVTTLEDGQNAVSYFSREYFETTKPEQAKAYNDAQ